MNRQKIRDIISEKNAPKICVPVMGTERESLMEELQNIRELPCDLVEWRADFLIERLAGESFGSVIRSLLGTLGFIRANLDKPVLFTIRTVREGGQADITVEDYFFVNRIVADSEMADMIDIEAFTAAGTDMVSEFVKYAHAADQMVLLSTHDFEKTLALEEMVEKYETMDELGGDVIKQAVMPQDEDDVARLLEAAAVTNENHPEKPLIAISMGELGMSSRICAGQFGSVITFAAGLNASAPGQIDAETLKGYLDQYYK